MEPVEYPKMLYRRGDDGLLNTTVNNKDEESKRTGEGWTAKLAELQNEAGELLPPAPKTKFAPESPPKRI